MSCAMISYSIFLEHESSTLMVSMLAALPRVSRLMTMHVGDSCPACLGTRLGLVVETKTIFIPTVWPRQTQVHTRLTLTMVNNVSWNADLINQTTVTTSKNLSLQYSHLLLKLAFFP